MCVLINSTLLRNDTDPTGSHLCFDFRTHFEDIASANGAESSRILHTEEVDCNQISLNE